VKNIVRPISNTNNEISLMMNECTEENVSQELFFFFVFLFFVRLLERFLKMKDKDRKIEDIY